MAEIRIKCECGALGAMAICSQNTKVECNEECLRLQRNKKLDIAFGTDSEAQLEYPEGLVELAKMKPKFLNQLETRIK